MAIILYVASAEFVQPVLIQLNVLGCIQCHLKYISIYRHTVVEKELNRCIAASSFMCRIYRLT